MAMPVPPVGADMVSLQSASLHSCRKERLIPKEVIKFFGVWSRRGEPVSEIVILCRLRESRSPARKIANGLSGRGWANDRAVCRNALS